MRDRQVGVSTAPHTSSSQGCPPDPPASVKFPSHPKIASHGAGITRTRVSRRSKETRLKLPLFPKNAVRILDLFFGHILVAEKWVQSPIYWKSLSVAQILGPIPDHNSAPRFIRNLGGVPAVFPRAPNLLEPGGERNPTGAS